MSRFLIWIYKLPLIGDALSYSSYAVMTLTILPFLAWIGGAQRLKLGTSVVWIPKEMSKEMQAAIQDGIELLRSRDSELFLLLTTKRRLIIYYSKANVINSHGRVFGIHSRYIEMGAEGVACFLAQSLLVSEAAPRVNQSRLNEQERLALNGVSRKMAEWLSKHSFHPGLVAPYRKIVERQERSQNVQML